jgi:hypothetical protein
MGITPNATWKRRLSELTMEEIARGIERDFERGDSWPPSAPEFVRMARGSYQDFGLLDPDEAFRAASSRRYLKGIYDAVSRVGVYEFQRMQTDKAKAAFLKSYEKTLDRVRAGARLTEPVLPDKQITHEPPPRSEEKHEEAMRQIRETLGMQTEECSGE